MPNFYLVWACGQLIDDEFSILIANRKVWGPGNDDDSAHPCMEYIAIDSDEADTVQPFCNLAPRRQTDIEQRLLAHTGVHGVKDRIAVFQQQVAAERGYLDMRRKGALFIVEDQLHRLRGSVSVERMECKNRILQSAMSSDEQSFVRYLGATE